MSPASLPDTATAGKPITARRCDYLLNRLGQHLPLGKTQQVTTHWIRHTILTWVEHRFAVAQAYAGHQDAARGARAMSATGTYVRAGCPRSQPPYPSSPANPVPLRRRGQAPTPAVLRTRSRLLLVSGLHVRS